ncbi:MAG: biopolymer transporter ExbD [Saprospiraceae bacterium]|nr:biopolymer transporter ExbD [Saprospiraceae bacterium]MBP6565800.1 biopolymer transporter ExbD [Saprospiraceae bacterium]
MATRRRMNNEINAGSMADIAFLLLIFFLVTTTISEDKGVLVKLPEWSPESPPPLPIHERNVFSVLVNAQNQLLVRGKAMDIADLKNSTKIFIKNPTNDPKMSENPSMAIISLKNDRATKYQMYIEVYNELKSAYNELWEEESRTKYRQNLNELTALQQKTIKDAIPLVISEAEPTEYGEEK